MDRIEVLINEKKVMREEIIEIKKVIYTSLFSLIAVIGIFFTYLVQKNGIEEFIQKGHYLIYAIIVSQIEFVITMFIFSLDSTLRALNAYLSVIDDKINEALGEELITWESHRKRFTLTNNGIEYYCFVALYVFFVSIYFSCIYLITLEVLTNGQLIYFLFLIVQMFEFITIFFIALKKRKEYERAKYFFTESRKTILTR